MLPSIRATHVVSAIRGGSSLPVVVDTEGGSRFIVKLRGAGGGVRDLARDAIYAYAASAVGIAVPRRALIDIPKNVSTDARHEEVLDVLHASTGQNLGFELLADARPYVFGKSPPPPADVASRVVALDLFFLNVDRTESNPNILVLPDRTHVFTDHASLLLFEHEPDDPALASDVTPLRSHVLRSYASRFGPEALRTILTLSDAAIEGALADTPADWLGDVGRMRKLLRVRRDRSSEWRSAAQHVLDNI